MGYPAAHQRLAGGEAVVYLLTPVVRFGLGIDALAAWGLDPSDYIAVRINMGLGTSSNPNGTEDGRCDARFTRQEDGPALTLPPQLHWTQLSSKEWKARFIVQKCSRCDFVDWDPEQLTGHSDPFKLHRNEYTVEQVIQRDSKS